MKRVEILQEMLRRYGEAQETMNKGGMGDGSSVTLMPLTWNRSYRRLEGLLKEMRECRPSQWWHVTERYLRSSERVAEVRVRRTARGPELVLPAHSELGAGAAEIAGSTARVKLIVWNPAVRAHKVELALEWLALDKHWPEPPCLPQEFLEKKKPVEEPEKAAA